MRKKRRSKVLAEIFSKFPQATLARKLRVTKMAVNSWTRVPQHHVRKVASLTGLSLKRLRPDLYDPNYGKRGI